MTKETEVAAVILIWGRQMIDNQMKSIDANFSQAGGYVTSHAEIQGKNVAGRQSSLCKGPEVGSSLGCWRKWHKHHHHRPALSTQ